MEILRFDLAHLPPKREKLSLALGHFDGCHKGHQKLFVETSLGSSGEAAALLFENPFPEGPYLSSIDDKIRYAQTSRLDALYVLRNEASFFDLSPEEFIENVLLPLGTARVCVGEDFRFGKGGKGTIEDLRKHFEVQVIPLLKEAGEKVSSSAIKLSLQEGNLTKANEFLGKPYEVSGIVSKGQGRGKSLGYPTLNLQSPFPYLLPRNGVYCAVVYLSGIAYRAMVNVGVHPSVGSLDAPLLEAHVLDFSQDVYGKKAYVAFLSYIREEKTFASIEELKEQLKKDEASVREILA